MPTVEDMLSEVELSALEINTSVCWACGGRKRVADFGHDPEEVTLDDGRVALVPRWSECEQCNGDGVIVPSLAHTGVTSMVVCAAVGQMYAARTREQFDTMNRVLDWSMTFMSRAIADSPAPLEESLSLAAENLEKVRSVSGANGPDEANGSALTEQELRDLGVTDG